MLSIFRDTVLDLNKNNSLDHILSVLYQFKQGKETSALFMSLREALIKFEDAKEDSVVNGSSFNCKRVTLHPFLPLLFCLIACTYNLDINILEIFWLAHVFYRLNFESTRWF